MDTVKTALTSELSPEDIGTNTSHNPHLTDLLGATVSRRQALLGGLSGSVALFGGLSLAGCTDSDDTQPLALGFTAVPKSTADVLSVPPGYTARPLISWGQPLIAGQAMPAHIYDLTSEQQKSAIGDHHDGMYYFGLGAGNAVPGTPDRNNSSRGLLVMNHEATTEDFVHPDGPSFNNLDASGNLTDASARTDAEECLKEMALHGVSITELAKDAGGQLQIVQNSPYNRRLTVMTEMQLSGPITTKPELTRTRFSAQPGKTDRARGTLNNCAFGHTPWGTYLTCEENWAGYFGHAGTPTAEQSRYGIGLHGFQQLRWYSAPDTADQLLSRFQLNPTGATPADDYRNEANNFGYIVEVDPYDPTSIPKKRTALGRMGHEGCWPSFRAGRRMAFYMGDDNRNDYFYKFVTDAVYTGGEQRVNDILDTGTLYVARFDGNGGGQWLPLTVASLNDPTRFPTQADICVNTRLAADAVGATKMDRPEWASVNPLNGEVYLTLTNNSNRRPAGTTTTGSQLLTDAANPRAYEDTRGSSTSRGNVNGHTIRLREAGDDPAATTFSWDIYLFGAQADADPNNVNLSKLTDENDHSSPDGLWFDPRGVLWIQTDDGAYTDVTNCMMLAAIPGHVGDGSATTLTNTAAGVSGTQVTAVGRSATPDTLRRFLVGPKGCEITGIAMTPDGRAMFVNIQHPGESGGFDTYDQSTHTFTAQSTFNVLPGDNRARSVTMLVTRDDGGIIGL